MTAIRGKIVADNQKFIIQIDGDNGISTDFHETEMKLIAIGPHQKVEAIFKDSSGNHIFKILFSDKIEISKNMLDEGIMISIDGGADVVLDSQTIQQFIQYIHSNMSSTIQTDRDWSQI